MIKVIQVDTRQKRGKHTQKHDALQKMGIYLVSSKVPYGDYALVSPISIDTKKDMEEIAGEIGGASHKTFIAECKGAKDAGCKLIILVENTEGITDISQVHDWKNPRTPYSPKCIQGPRLQKAMQTITERYGTEFWFCHPSDSAKIIADTLEKYEWKKQ